MSHQKIKLQSVDGQIFEVDVEVANMSITLKDMFESKKITRSWGLNFFLN